MNSLSWLLYLASVSADVDFVCGFLVVVGGLFCLVSIIVSRVRADDDDAGTWKALATTAVRVWLVAAALGILSPSKDTIYAIAVSEYGEEALKTPEASKARQALNAWLDKQIGPTGDAKPEAE